MPKFVLVTGATGFIGAHIVDALLARGLRVRGATRSLEKGDAMIKTRLQYREKLEFVQIDDFEHPGGLVEAVRGVDGVIHAASVRVSLQLLRLTRDLTLCSYVAIYLQYNKQRARARYPCHQRCTCSSRSC